jgi:phosphatidate cytidylyltransferase
VVLAASAIGLREWMRMALPPAEGAAGPLTVTGASSTSEVWLGVVVGTALAGAFIFAGEREMVVPAATAGATLAVFLFHLFRAEPIERVAARVAMTLAGFLYVGLLGFLAHLKRRGPDGGGWIYVALTIAWLSDTGAYFAGRFLGPLWPKKLYPAVSPKKTVMGSLGGVAGSYLGLVIAKAWYLPSLSWVDTVAIAVPANALGQLGDLCESLVKRSVGVKDSGRILPGHGGMLDRIDALLFVVPYVYVYARWVYGAP